MNKLIGDREIELDGEKFVCRPDFEALANFESYTDSSALKLQYEISNLAMKVSHVAAFIYYTHKAYAPETKVTMREIGNMVFKDGITNVIPQVVEMLGYVLTGGDEGKKKEPESPET